MSRMSDPNRPWWKDVVCYQVWPLSFKDSNADGRGDIQGIISKLDYLKDLGIDVVWVCPTYKSPMKDYGYDISGWQDMHPDFGTLQDMLQLIEEVHKRDMRILLDLVVTHTSNMHPWFLESRASKVNEKSDWYIWKDPRPGNMIHNTVTGVEQFCEEPTNWCACFGGSAWTYAPERDQYYLHLFMSAEPDLNWENPVLRQAVFEEALGFWLDKGIDGFRIDTVNRISKDWNWPDAPIKLKTMLQPGSDYYINGPRSHEFLQEMRKYVDNHPKVKESVVDLMLVGELPRTPFDQVLKYTHPDSKELSMVFDFDVVKLGGHDNPDEVKPHQVKNLCDGDPSFTLSQFKKELKKVQDLIANGSWGTVFMENHDQCRSINRYATPDPQYHDRAAKLLCLMQTTLSGTNFVFQGQEIAMTDMPTHWDYDDLRDPAAKGYLEDQRKLGPEAYEIARRGNCKFGRENARTPVQWNFGRNGGFSDAEEGGCWIGVNGNYKEGLNVEAQQADEDSVWHFWKKHIAMRKEHFNIFMHGSFEILDEENEKSFTYLKKGTNGWWALVCLNFSDEPQKVTVPEGRSVNSFLSGNVGRPDDVLDLLEAWEGRVYLMREHENAIKTRDARFPYNLHDSISEGVADLDVGEY